MAEESTQGQGYTMGYSEEFLQLLDRRSAQSHAGYLLPHLKAGDRVLDFGCGPGTITVGLAKAVEPGEVHGIDMEESQVELARAAADAGGHGTAPSKGPIIGIRPNRPATSPRMAANLMPRTDSPMNTMTPWTVALRSCALTYKPMTPLTMEMTLRVCASAFGH